MIINKDNDGMYFVIIVQRFQQDPIITFVKKKNNNPHKMKQGVACLIELCTLNNLWGKKHRKKKDFENKIFLSSFHENKQWTECKINEAYI